MSRLTAFQADLLTAIGHHDGATSGQNIQRWLESTERYDSINHGRLYPNLDELDSAGLIDKLPQAIDDRTNGYTLTDDGRAWVADRREWLGGGL